MSHSVSPISYRFLIPRPASPRISYDQRRRARPVVRGFEADSWCGNSALMPAWEVPRLNIRPARVGDVPAIYELIRTFADRKLMIRRSMGELYESIREFLVAVDDENRVIGCVALHVFWEDLAELKCLAVSGDAQGQGVGRQARRRLLGGGPRARDRLGLRPDLFGRVLRALRLPSDRQGRAAAQDLERVRALPALSRTARRSR